MENIRNTVNEIKNLMMLLHNAQQKLTEKGESDPSEGSILQAKLAVDQLKEKLDTILGPEEPTGAEGLEVEIHENE